jgi:hypothetical protein
MRFMHLLTQPRRSPQRPTSTGYQSPGSQPARTGDEARRAAASRQR